MATSRRAFGLICSLVALLAGTIPGMGQEGRPTLPCSLGDTDWRSDPVFLRSQDPSSRGREGAPLRCRVEDTFDFNVDGEPLNVVRAKVFEANAEDGYGAQQSVNLFIFSKGAGAQERVIGRFLEPYNISRDKPSFFLRLAQIQGGTLVLLGRQVRTAYWLEGDKIRPIDSHAWLEAAVAATPVGWRAGPVRNIEPGNFGRPMTGYVAIFRADADDPSRPGSTIDEGQAIEVDLVLEETRLTAVNPRVVPAHYVKDEEWWEGFVSNTEEMRIARSRLPRGTEPCEIMAWSADPDPAGLSLREGPSAQARVIGRIPPPWKAPDRYGDRGQVYRSQFKVIGYRKGWFLVRDITAPGVAYRERYPRNLPQAPRGQGWVSARLVGAALANQGQLSGVLHQAPSEFAATREATRRQTPIGAGDPVQRLHACSGSWGLIEIGGGRGWWRGICANQVTNCS